MGVHAYDWHLERDDGRRCQTTEEMVARGWRQDDENRWFDPAHVERALNAFSEQNSPRLSASEAEDDRETA